MTMTRSEWLILTTGLIAISAVFLTGCETTGSNTLLRQEAADANYRPITMNFKTNLGSETPLTISVKLIEHQGKTAICGFYLNPSTGCDGRVIEDWMFNATLALDDKPAGSARYFPQSRPAMGVTSGYPANCAVTDLPWDAKYGRNPWQYLKPVSQGGRAWC